MLFFDSAKKIHDFLAQNGTDVISHVKGRTFHQHLTRVADLLNSWGLDVHAVRAGLCHSLYSTEKFNTVILTIDRRPELTSIIGSEAEELVFHFCSMKRDSFVVARDGAFTYISRTTGSTITLEKEIGVKLLHILFANDIDHVHDFNVLNMSAFLTNRYASFAKFLFPKANAYLECIRHPDALMPSQPHFVRFIGHAGLHIQSTLSLVVDPWLYSSVREKGKLQGLDPTSYTIDFMIPEPRNIPREIAPEIVLLSHFHTHHAPLEEIREFARIKPIVIVCPPLSGSKLSQIKVTLTEEVFDRITFHFVEEDKVFQFGDIVVSALYHTKRGHLGFLITTPQGSAFHLSDPHASNNNSLEFDVVWDKFNNLRPDFAFISCAGHAQRKVLDTGERIIEENQTFTPTQAAKFAIKIGAKNAGAVGIFNHSVWTDRIEFSRSSSESEREFHWALSFLSPSTRVLTLRPGDIFYFNA